MMNTIQPIDNDADCVPLYLPQSLFLKPFARINVSVTLPGSVTGKPISNFDIMEKLRSMVQPERFAMLKVSKSTIEFIRFEGELEHSKEVSNVLERLDGRNIKLANFVDLFKVRASLAKDTFPARHAWDSYFRDARDMDEMKPGERPDTVHLSNLPIRWFCAREKQHDENVLPSESIFRRIFDKFGKVRAVDIPICDPYRKEMKTQMAGVHTFSHDNEQYFEGYVQFEEYLGFTETMRAFRNMKLVRKEQKSYAINIVVDFDRKKHLSDASVKRRKVVRDRCIAKEQAREEEEKQKKLAELEKREQQKKQEEAKRQLLVQQQLERENKRKEKQLQKLRSKEQVEISSKIRAEEKKLQLAQKKLESIRVLEALFERIKIKAPLKTAIKKEKHHGSGAQEPNGNGISAAPVGKGDLRNKLVTKFKTSHEEDVERQRNRLMLAKSSGLLEAALKAGGRRSPSVTSISSDDSVLSDNKQKKKKKKATKKKKKKKKDEASSSSVSSELSEAEPVIPPLLGHHPLPGGFPMYNPETGQYMGMSMYSPFGNQFFPPGPIAARSEYYPPAMGYRGGGGPSVYRGGPRGRYQRGGNRGGMRGGRGGYNDGTQNRFDDEHDYRRGRYSRSRSNSRGRRSYSRSRSNKSHSRARRSRSKSKKKLVSTLRKSNSSTRWSSRSRSSSRTKDRRSWSRKSSRSRSRSRHRRHASRSRSRTRSSRSRSRSASHRPSRSRSNNKRNRSASAISRVKSSRTRSNGRHSRDNISKRAYSKTPTEDRKRSESRERNRSSNRENKPRRSDSREASRPPRSSRDDRRRSASAERRRSRSESTKRSVSREEREPSVEERNGRAASVDSSGFRSPKRKPAGTTPDRIFEDE